jgi:hypothetical protein
MRSRRLSWKYKWTYICREPIIQYNILDIYDQNIVFPPIFMLVFCCEPVTRYHESVHALIGDMILESSKE